MFTRKYNLLTSEETAERLNVPLGTLRSWVSREQGPDSVKINGRRMFLREVVDAWAEANPSRVRVDEKSVEAQIQAQLAALETDVA